MASSMIHICVANEINKIINKDKKSILIGSIAPDIAKQIGLDKQFSHFQGMDDDKPVLERFLNKYKNNLSDDFVLGYYIHLYTDYYWFKYFLTEFIKNDFIYTLDGKALIISDEEKVDYIYRDYTNLNIKLIDEYMLDLKIFYEPVPKFKNIIKEIPMEKLNIIIDKASVIIENTNESKSYFFDIQEVKKFIEFSVSGILENLKELGVIE